MLTAPHVYWRDDHRCGAEFMFEDGTPAICNDVNIDGVEFKPCCSSLGECGISSLHCR